jgi:hypothetical protein
MHPDGWTTVNTPACRAPRQRARLATDPLGLVIAGAYHCDPEFFPGDDAPAVGQRLFVLQKHVGSRRRQR